jgi:hypothetical protein
MLTNKLLLALFIIATIAVGMVGYVVATQTVSIRLATYTSENDRALRDQANRLTALSLIMARGGADNVVEALIADCPLTERERFDDLLGRLDSGLANNQLRELSRLFDRCAKYFAQQKAVMAARFAREVEWYEHLVKQAQVLEPQRDPAVYAVGTWQAMADIEADQAEHMKTLVQLQESIINALITGKSIESSEIDNLLAQVRVVQDNQSYLMIKINDMRAGLPTTP